MSSAGSIFCMTSLNVEHSPGQVSSQFAIVVLLVFDFANSLINQWLSFAKFTFSLLAGSNGDKWSLLARRLSSICRNRFARAIVSTGDMKQALIVPKNQYVWWRDQKLYRIVFYHCSMDCARARCAKHTARPKTPLIYLSARVARFSIIR